MSKSTGVFDRRGREIKEGDSIKGKFEFARIKWPQPVIWVEEWNDWGAGYISPPYKNITRLSAIRKIEVVNAT